LRVVEHEGDKLHGRFLTRVALGIGLTYCRAGRDTLTSDQREEVPFEHKTQNKEYQESTNADVHSANARTTLITTVFEVITSSAWSPTHNSSPATGHLAPKIIVAKT
jgi:hypothetical protein